MHNILIVEDEYANRMLLKDILEDIDQYALKIYEAETGSKAINIMKSNDIELVFVDMKLPDMDGKDIGQAAHGTVVLITGMEMKEDLYSHWAQEYIQKPYDEKDILNIINKYF